MGFTVKSYEGLKSQYAEEIVAFRGHHKVTTVDKLKEPRRGQVQFLNEVITQLDSSSKDVNEKARILTGIMLMIRAQIAGTYSWRSPSNSFLAESLVKIVGITDENAMDKNSEARLVNAAQKFYASKLYENGDTTHPLLEENCFSHIKGFDQGAFWKLGVSMEAQAQDAVFIESDAARAKVIADRAAAEAKVSGGGFFSRFNPFGGSSSANAEEKADKAPTI